MANKVALKRYIRFQLEQMSQLNDHHRFEHLSFEIAKRRIASNVVPATGPVQAGGDQGRDFESFRTYLAADPRSANTYLAKLSDKTLVFACTLDKKIVQKIKGDLATIFGGGVRPTEVYYFCVPDLPVAQRHLLQDFCKTTYQAHLEIFDGQAVSDILSDGDCFWIAQEFLSVPAEMLPVVEHDEEYAELREIWLVQKREITALADFLDVKRGLRRATFEKSINPDLDAWVSVIRTKEDEPYFRRRVLYEVAVANLRGRGSMDSQLEQVREFFATLPEDPDSNELEDAFNLASYANTSAKVGQFSAALEEVKQWQDKVRLAGESALIKEQTKPDKFDLLLRKGQLSIWDFIEVGEKTLAAEGMRVWLHALDLADQHPLCRIGRLSDIVQIAAPLIGHIDPFDQLTDRLDLLIAEKDGAASAADKSRNRGIAFAQVGNLLKAIDQIQRAKIGWLSGETLSGSILATLLLAQWYAQLRLHLAARYYAMAALYLARRADSRTANQHAVYAGFLVAESFYENGEGLSFLGVVDYILPAHWELLTDPADIDKHQHLARAIEMATVVSGVIPQMHSMLGPHVERILGNWPLAKENIDGIKEQGKDDWSKYSLDGIETLQVEQLGHRLDEDLRHDARVSWRALGIEWVVVGARSSRVAVDYVATVMQILHVEFADIDLLILPSNVEIRVGVAIEALWSVEQLPDNGRLIWQVHLPLRGDGLIAADPNTEESVTFKILALLTKILGQASALAIQSFLAKVEKKMKRGLVARIIWVRPADELLAEARAMVIGDTGVNLPVLSVNPKTVAPLGMSELAGPDDVPELYSIEKAEEFIRNRYDGMIKPLGKAVKKLMANSKSRALLLRLHNEGLPDWRILLILLNLSLNKVVHEKLQNVPFDRKRYQQAVKDAQKNIVTAGVDNLRPSDVSEEEINRQRTISIMSVFGTWGLTNHRETPDFNAVEKFLIDRFRLHEDDVEHPEIFYWSAAEASSTY